MIARRLSNRLSIDRKKEVTRISNILEGNLMDRFRAKFIRQVTDATHQAEGK